MNTPPNDTPELTAYALGELSATQAREVHAMLASLPSALSELEQVEAITDALRQGAPIPQQRLTPEQRHAVLHPAPQPRLLTPMMPRRAPVRRPSQFWPALRTLTQAAAVVALAGVAFVLGRNMPLNSEASTTAAAVTPAPAADETAREVAVVSTPAAAAHEQPSVPRPVIEPAPAPVVARVSNELQGPPAPTAATAPPKAEVAVTPAAPAAGRDVAATVATAPAAPAKAETLVAKAPVTPPATPAPAPVLAFTTPPANDNFVSASRQASSQFALKPAQIRPLPARQDRAQQLASPAPQRAPADAKAAKPARPAELFIHSWHADVTSCPWNETNRLLRVVIQLPADQPAAAADFAYPVQVAFDANAVRDYRLLCERHMPASELRSAGTHVLWYEFLPNGAGDPNRETGRHIATVTLPGARFTTQTVAPFDGSKLRVLDRGVKWEAARDDFLFESSVVGFGLLLRGAPQTGQLNHQLVLNLAGKAREADPSPERARFVRLVQEAKQAAGL
jgi:hypothetical protein